MPTFRFQSLLLGFAGLSLLAGPACTEVMMDTGELKKLKEMGEKYAPVDLKVTTDHLPTNEKRALAEILHAAKIMDALFLQQVWSGNAAMLVALTGDRSPMGQARLTEFLRNKGPWSRLDENEAFIAGAPPKPEGAAYYPAGSTREGLNAWLETLSPEERKSAAGFFTTIRKDAAGTLRAVPYSTEYQSQLELAAAHLRAAAELTAQPTLKAYLAKRADAFLSNDYYDSDVAWMELDASIEPTIGPYEVYEDKLLNAKAAFEAFITLRDDAETKKLARFSGELQGIEDNLPIDPKLRNPSLGSMAPIRVVNSIFSSGDANCGVQTAAFNLPNDERVTREKGAKRVMLKNVQEAKFKRVLIPISRIVLAPADQANVAFDAFFTHILMHELMHGLGPHSIQVDGKATTVRAALQEIYSAAEEAKADISGLWALQHLVDKGVVDASMERTMYTTFLASTFRSIRFGIDEAHGRGIALQLNTLLDKGGVRVATDGTFSVDTTKIKEAVRELTSELLTLQAHGEKARITALFEKKAVMRPEIQRALDRMGEIPIDIAPHFVTAETLLSETAAVP